MKSPGKLAMIIASAALAFLLLLPEFVYWAAARALPAPALGNGDCAILVLGYPSNLKGGPSPMQRQRVAVAVELMASQKCEVMVVSGGNPHSPEVEADNMAMVAREAGIPDSKLFLEREATSTWHNIALSMKWIEKSGRILLVSDSLHVHRGKRVFCKDWPDMCAKVTPVARYRFGELYPDKVYGMLYENVLTLLRDFF